MAFLAYFAALSAMGAFIFGLSILLEPAPMLPAKKVVAEQTAKPPAPPVQRVAAKPAADEPVTEPAAAVIQATAREDDEAPPMPTETARAAMASAPQQAGAAAMPTNAEPDKPKPRKTAARARAPTHGVEEIGGQTLRYVGMVNGMPTYQVVR